MGKKGYSRNHIQVTRHSFKLDVLNYMNDHGTPPNETATIFNITSPGLIRKWREQFTTQGLDALKSKKKGRQTVKKGNKEIKTR